MISDPFLIPLGAEQLKSVTVIHLDGGTTGTVAQTPAPGEPVL